MEEYAFTTGSPLAGSRVAVLGLGLMGGSLAMGLHGRCRQLIGIDPDPEALRLAAGLGIFDRLSAQPKDHLAGSDLVILAAPVRAILRLLADLPTLHPGSPVVIDLGSTKVEVLAAMQSLPARFDPLGGHPMCGKEKTSLAAADPAIFIDRPFVFTRLQRTSPAACQLAEQLAQDLQAVSLWLDAPAHDRWVSATSHLPYLVACALASITPLEAAPLASTGFASTTRVAATSPSVMLDVLLTNRANLLESITGFRRSLDELEASLVNPEPTLLGNLLTTAAAQRQAVLEHSISGGLS